MLPLVVLPCISLKMCPVSLRRERVPLEVSLGHVVHASGGPDCSSGAFVLRNRGRTDLHCRSVPKRQKGPARGKLLEAGRDAIAPALYPCRPPFAGVSESGRCGAPQV